VIEPGNVDLPDVVAEVRTAFAAYEAALLRNDVAALNEFFWDDPRALRYGIAERSVGIAAIRLWRRQAPAIAATRRLRDTQIVAFGRDTASVCTEFTADDPPTVAAADARHVGRQSQLWVRFAAGWRIVAAHVSFPASAAAGAVRHTRR
jgi:ketosteroid isomerase-like protein